MKSNKRQIGKQQEERAALFLIERGYEVLERNFWCRFGEIDIIAKQGEYLVFCEVKFRGQEAYGDGICSIDRRKRNHLWKAANHYLQQNHLWDIPCRFDVISMTKEALVLYENAFEARE